MSLGTLYRMCVCEYVLWTPLIENDTLKIFFKLKFIDGIFSMKIVQVDLFKYGSGIMNGIIWEFNGGGKFIFIIGMFLINAYCCEIFFG